MPAGCGRDGAISGGRIIITCVAEQCISSPQLLRHNEQAQAALPMGRDWCAWQAIYDQELAKADEAANSRSEVPACSAKLLASSIAAPTRWV